MPTTELRFVVGRCRRIRALNPETFPSSQPDPVSAPNFFAELKRRNVYKVAVAYAVVSWLLVQAASILFPTFEAPVWVMKVFVTILVLGFPVALILSWAFEITPEGIKRESEVTPDESITAHTGRKIIGLTIGVAVLAAALFALQMLRPKATAWILQGGAPATHRKLTASPTSLAGACPSVAGCPRFRQEHRRSSLRKLE